MLGRGIWLLSICCVVLASPVTTPFSVVESLPGEPHGWTKLEEAHPTQDIRFHLSMEHNKQEQFEQTLLEVSDPYHPRYGNHLSQEEMKALLRPSSESTLTITTWLREGGAKDIEDDGEWIHFTSSVQQAENLLNTKFGLYKHENSGVESTRAMGYSVPQHCRQHIRMIHPITRFGQPRPQISTTGRFVPLAEQIPAGVSRVANTSAAGTRPTAKFDSKFCNSTITPDCLRGLYSMGDYQPTPGIGSLGVAGYLDEIPKVQALQGFISKHAPYAAGTNISIVAVNGGSVDQAQNLKLDDVEANLDVQYTAPFLAGTSTVYYSTGGLGPLENDLNFPKGGAVAGNEPFLDWLTYMSKLPNAELPQTITTSYSEDEQSIPETYTKTVCDMFGALGARGVSILFSSGDDGPGTGCQANFGNLAGKPRFIANFPGTCPWVTVVGGTVGVMPEHAVNLSSGGFSERFPRPKYQEAAVQTYLKTVGTKFSGLYNPDGRAIPDVAAQAKNFMIIATGPDAAGKPQFLEGVIGGTSASAPVFASVVSLMNNARLTNNMSAMGFLNPWLYGPGKDGLTDVTTGRSEGCTDVSQFSKAPSPAIPGAGWYVCVIFLMSLSFLRVLGGKEGE